MSDDMNTPLDAAAPQGLDRLTLRKEEKLRHKTLVDMLFREGKSFFAYPLRVVWKVYDNDSLNGSFRCELPPRIGPMQMLITVPKKRMRHAVDRVLLRRRIREAYRLNRMPLKKIIMEDGNIRTLSMAWIYSSDKIEDYHHIEKRIKILLGRIAQALQTDK